MSYGTAYVPMCLHCGKRLERTDVVVMGLRFEADMGRPNAMAIIAQPAHKACQENYDAR